MNTNKSIENPKVKNFLAGYLRVKSPQSEPIGAGAWSTCYAFRKGDEDLVIRFGKYVEDFYVDEIAYQYVNPNLPIPKVLEIGQAFDGYYAISTRVFGEPLESLNSQDWLATVPSVVAAFEAMRLADLSGTTGWGGWEKNKRGSHKSWSEFLLSVTRDTPDLRIHGWREKLLVTPQQEAFAWGMDLLKTLVTDDSPRALVHSDLINRNVFVKDHKISGVFDWGCALYGDHLYDLAWLEFWSPWYPELDMVYFRKKLEQAWEESGYSPEHKDSRLLACHLHIGLSHLAYNAFMNDPVNLGATAKRMKELVHES
jgi:hygromycin-B 4-O-kinase